MLQAGQGGCIQPATAGDVNKLLEGFPGAPLSAKVIEECRKWLLQHFANVREVITKDMLLGAFRNLGAPAVILWMECDSLIGTENDVAILVTCWHSGKKGKAAKDDHLVALSRLLHLGSLAPSILESALPELSWFKEVRLLRPFVHTFRRYGSSCVQLYPMLEIPAAWVAHARNGSTPGAQLSKGPEEVVWRVPVSAVTEMVRSEAAALYASPVLYSNGIFFRAYLRPLRPSMELRLSLELASSHGVPVPPALDVSLSIKQRRLEQRLDVTHMPPRRLAPHSDIQFVNEEAIVLVSGSRLSWTLAANFLGFRPTAGIIHLYPELLFDGHLVFDIALQPK